MLTVFGSVALDTIRCRGWVEKDMLGGSAAYAAVSASNFVDTGLITVVGSDLPKEHHGILSKRLNLDGLVVREGKTFRYDGEYDDMFSTRTSLETELNVVEGFVPVVPEGYKDSKFVYLANNDPEQNVSVLEEFDGVKFSMCDTIDFWISTKREAVVRMIKAVDAVVINDEEARLLTKEHNLVRCARTMKQWGAEYVIIKKGEHGALIFHEDEVFPTPGFPLDDVTDPTGAGDAFAGAMMGHLADVGAAGISEIRKAAIYGNVMGSFAVQGRGLDRLLRIKEGNIAERVKAYRNMTEL